MRIIANHSIPQKIKQAPRQKKLVPPVKYTLKDSVFTNLFSDKKYLLQLYRVLHPEDSLISEEDLTDITIHNVLTNALYNDLGFMARKRLIVLVEAQSSWSLNILIRILLYIARSYHDYILEHNGNLYSSKKVVIPAPEFYVVYSGKTNIKKKWISLSEEFFDGADCGLEVKVRVISGDLSGSIIDQYISFAKVYNEQLKLMGRSLEAIQETIRICKDRDILREYLEAHEKEVLSMGFALLEDEQIMRIFIEDQCREAAEEAEKKFSENIFQKALKMLKMGKISLDDLPSFFPELTQKDIDDLLVKLHEE